MTYAPQPYSKSMLIFFGATVFMRRETAYDRLFESFLCKRKRGIILAIKTSSNATQKRTNQYRLSSNCIFSNSNWDKKCVHWVFFQYSLDLLLTNPTCCYPGLITRIYTVRTPLQPAVCKFFTPSLKSISLFSRRFFQKIMSLYIAAFKSGL